MIKSPTFASRTIAARELSPGDCVYLAPRSQGAATILTAAPMYNGAEIHITFSRDESNSRGNACLAPELEIETAPRGEILQVFHIVHTEGYAVAIFRGIDAYFQVTTFPHAPEVTSLRYLTKREAGDLASLLETQWSQAGKINTSYRHHDF